MPFNFPYTFIILYDILELVFIQERRKIWD